MKQNPTPTKTKHVNVLIIASLCFFITQSLDAQVCSNPNNIFAISSNGVITTINSTNAVVGSQINTASYSGASPSNSNAMGYNTIDGLFYYFKVNPGAGSQQFISYSPLLNMYTTLAASPANTWVVSGCINNNGTGYYCVDAAGNFYYYNILSDKWTTITSNIRDQYNNSVSSVIQSQQNGDMAIDGYGNLWMVTSSANAYGLYQIMGALPTSAKASVTAVQMVAPTASTPDGQALNGVAFNANGDLFMSSGADNLYKLTNLTSLTKIGKFSVSGAAVDLTSCSFPLSVLPITWASFTTSLNDNKVSLDWGFSAGQDIKGFYVEKSTDSKNWQVVNYVAYAEGVSKYSSIDANPAQGNSYYRIREEDNNDKENYSVINLVTVSSSVKIAVWPNPAKDVVYVQNNGSDNNLKTSIFDQFGKMMEARILHEGNNAVNVSNFPAGTYIIHIQSADGTVYNEKVIKR